MSWITEWPRLSKRIEAFERSAEMYLTPLLQGVADFHNLVGKRYVPLADTIVHSIESLGNDPSLPMSALDSIRQFMSEWKTAPWRQAGWVGLQVQIGYLASLRLVLDQQLSELQLIARRQIHRAFLHLDRSIVADPDVRRKWQRAFADKEPALERLGAVHLLLHGIWAFKVDSAGERTDLVLGDCLAVGPDIREAAEGMVLTEWKKVNSASELSAKAAQARDQARLYSKGCLAGFEIADLRLLVLVSRTRLIPPAPETFDGITYRFVNVAVDPESPSRTASQLAGR